MRKIVLLFVLITVGFGIYYVFKMRSSDSDVLVVEDQNADMVDGVVKDSNGWSYANSERVWVMSTEWVSVTLPVGWKIQQADAGGLSRVNIARSEGQSSVIMINVFTPREFVSGEPIAYETWKEEFMAEVEVDPCPTVRLDAFNADCFEAEDGYRYLLLKSAERYFRVQYPTEVSADLQAVIDRIDFYPDPGSLVNSIIIP